MDESSHGRIEHYINNTSHSSKSTFYNFDIFKFPRLRHIYKSRTEVGIKCILICMINLSFNFSGNQKLKRMKYIINIFSIL